MRLLKKLANKLSNGLDESLGSLHPKDKATGLAYARYVSENRSPLSHFISSIIFIIYSYFLISDTIFVLSHSESKSFVGAKALFSVILVSNVLVHFSGWALLAVKLGKKVGYANSIVNYMQTQQFNLLAISQLSFTLNVALYMIGRTFAGGCEHPMNTSDYQVCNNYAASRVMPMDAFIILVINPMLYLTVLRETRPLIIFSGWLIGIVAMVICSIQLQSNLGAVLIAINGAFSPIIFYDVLRLNFEQFTMNKKLEEAMAAIDESAQADRASEMRHMIANVAHDLKTVNFHAHYRIVSTMFYIITFSMIFCMIYFLSPSPASW